MKRIHRIAIAATVLFILFAASPHTAQAQWVLLPDSAHRMVEAGLDYMYDLRYSQADSVFNKLSQDFPDHPAGAFLLALTDWWRIKPNIADDNAVKRHSASFDKHLDRVISLANARLDENQADIIGLFFKGAAYGYRARLKATYKPDVTSLPAWFAIFKDANEGRKALLECQRLAPSNSDVLLGSGLFNYYVDAMPEKYPILKAVRLPQGDKEIGLQMLRISAKSALYAKVEADYALLEILTNIEKKFSEAVQIAERLHTKYPNNPDFHKYYARTLYYTGSYAKAEEAWEELFKRVRARQNGYELSLVRQGLYYLGDIKIRQGDAEKAIVILKEAVKVNKRLDEESSGYYVASVLKLGNAYDKAGQRSEAIKQYKAVIDNGDASDEYINRAKKYVEAPFK